jgi:ribosome-associated heat shock protein Hsp15
MLEPLSPERVRLDKFLWAARFFKTRQAAADEASKGRVEINGQSAKPGREVKAGDIITLRQQQVQRTVVVQHPSAVRGPASVAQTLYEETPESVAARERAAQQRRLSPEPALAQVKGRPTKRDRRELDRAGQPPAPTGWGERWSASLED